MAQYPQPATPIIVVGINRSGTKWLSNEIAAHPDVASVQAEVHGGIVESNLLTDYGRGFNLNMDDEYRRFLDFWESTHFFQLAHGDRTWFESLSTRPAVSVDAFRLLMDRLAAQQGVGWWVQKVAPCDAEPVLSVLVDARVVAIQRTPVDAVRSRVKLDALRGIKTSPIRAGMSLGVQERQLESVIAAHDAFVVKYESLVSERTATMNAVFDFAGLSRLPAGSTFAPNTSFARSDDRRKTLGLAGEMTVRAAIGICGILPLPVLNWLQSRFTRGRPDIIPGTFAHEEA